MNPEHTLPQTKTGLNSNSGSAQTSEATESVVISTNKLLTDLKKAYTQVLQSKEKEIQLLKQELADVNTLVKILEFENEKLRNYNR